MKRSSIRTAWMLPTLLALTASGCVGTDDEVTGSESHFVRCMVDEDCPTGTCEASYCEVNGERITTVNTLNGGDDVSGETTGDAVTDGELVEDFCEVLSRTPKTLQELGWNADRLNLPETTLPFTWNSTDWAQITIAPQQEDTEITLEVTVLENTLEHLERKQRAGVGGDQFCDSVDQVTMQYRLRTASGTFDEVGEATTFLGEEPRTLSFSLQADALGGSLKVTPIAENASTSFQFVLWWPEQELSGEVATLVTFPPSGNAPSSSFGTTPSSAPGRFSRTGCDPRNYYVDLDAQFGERTVGEEVAALATPTTLLGTWEDSGDTTEVTLTTTVDAPGGCHDGSRLQLPASIELSSADGKLRDLVQTGALHLLRAEDELSILEREVTGSQTLECGASELWPVQNVSCVDYAAVETSFSLNAYASRPKQYVGSLELYLFEPGSNVIGPADKVIGLQLTGSGAQ